MAVDQQYVARGAGSGNVDAFWVEEVEGAASPNLQRKGNLYAVAEGASAETALTLRAIRNQYYGDVTTTDVAVNLKGSLEAANSILLRQRGIGVSCVCAVVRQGRELWMEQVGYCHAYLYSSQDGAFERLTEGTYLPQTLGIKATVEGQSLRRTLNEGDVVLLCSGAVSEALDDSELATIASTVGRHDPQRAAERLVNRTRQQTGSEAYAAIVVACQVVEQPMQLATPVVERPLQASKAPAMERTPPYAHLRAELAPAPAKKRQGISLAWAKYLFLMVVLLGLAAASAWGGSQAKRWWSTRPQFAPTPTLSATELLRIGGPLPVTETPQVIASSPTPPATPAATMPTLGTPSPLTLSNADMIWERINMLWGEGDKGNMPALQEIVALLERLQVLTPNDPKVNEKLAVARVNLVYRQRMQEVASFWGSGEISPVTVASWSRVVEILEGLYAQKLAGYEAAIKSKLYAAHVNYGKALELVQRTVEARAQYERARQIDPARPEAIEALRLLR